MMIRHAIVDTDTSLVVNTIDYETDITNTIPPGMEAPMLAIANDMADIGWPYKDGVFTNPKKMPIGTSEYDWGLTFAEVIGRY